MKAQEVMAQLQISRSTLRRYREHGIIHTDRLPTGHFNYHAADVKRLQALQATRQTVLYARVANQLAAPALASQVKRLTAYAQQQGWRDYQVLQEIHSGVAFSEHSQLARLLKQVMQYQVARIVITDAQRLVRSQTALIRWLCRQYDTEIIILDDTASLDEAEISSELVTFLKDFPQLPLSVRKRGIK